MARSSLSLDDYLTLAKTKNLEFIGPAPLSSTEPTGWRCTLTGVIEYKSYVAVRQGTYGSRYQKTFQKSLKMYRDLASQLGIVFDYGHEGGTRFFPANTKTPTQWLSRRSKRKVVCSYHDLAYPPIQRRLIEELELE